MIRLVLIAALIANVVLGQDTTLSTSTTTNAPVESTTTTADATTTTATSTTAPVSLTTSDSTISSQTSIATTIDNNSYSNSNSIGDDSTFLTTSVFAESNGTTKPVHTCISLPIDLKQEAFGCVVDFRLWRVDCKKDIPLPSADNRVATAQGIAFELVRCPANETLKGRVSFRYALDLPNAIKSAADVAKLSVPDGNQLASRTVPINVTDSEVIVPIWPSSGIVELDVDGKLGNAASRKLGIALRLFNMQLNSSHVTFDVGLRVAPGATTFTDLTIARDVRFGFDDVCCLPGELLCPDEKEKCMSDDIGIKTWLFGGAPSVQATPSRLAAAAAGVAAMMMMNFL